MSEEDLTLTCLVIGILCDGRIFGAATMALYLMPLRLWLKTRHKRAVNN